MYLATLAYAGEIAYLLGAVEFIHLILGCGLFVNTEVPKFFSELVEIDEENGVTITSYRLLWIFNAAFLISTDNDTKTKTVSCGIGIFCMTPLITFGVSGG